jgi:hypothetical protein
VDREALGELQMTASLFEVRPLLEEHERKISAVERDVVLIRHAQTDLKLDVVDAGEKNRLLIINAIEINRAMLSDIVETLTMDVRFLRRELAALAVVTAVGFVAMIWLLVG